MNDRIRQLQKKIKRLEKQVQTEELLQAVWLELGPYTPHISNELRYKLQDYFGFDDSE